MKKDIEHSEWWYDYNRNDPNRPNPFEVREPEPQKPRTP